MSDFEQIALEQKRSAVRTMAWQLSLTGWRGNTVLFSILPYAALFYAGAKDEQWLRKNLSPMIVDLILANKPR